MAPTIATGFVRKLYRILDHESKDIISWGTNGTSFKIHDSNMLENTILPRYFRGKLSAFRQQLLDHGFQLIECENHETIEEYYHENFCRGAPEKLNRIERIPKKKQTRKHTEPISNMSLKATYQIPTQQVNAQESSLTLTWNTKTGTMKRTRTQQQQQFSNSKRPRYNEHTEQSLLFSHEPETTAQAASLLTGISGLSIPSLPRSTDLPEPISYLPKEYQGLQGNGTTGGNAQVLPMNHATAIMQQYPSGTDLPEDLVKALLMHFLSGPSINGIAQDIGTSTVNNVTSNQISNLISTMGELTSKSSTSNPLFSDEHTTSSTGKDKESDDDDPMFKLLMASSIDRVKSTIGDLTTPQEKINLLLAEKAKLEEQWAKRDKSNTNHDIPLHDKTERPGKTNPLFANTDRSMNEMQKLNGTSFASTSGILNHFQDNDLLRLLLTSSIDVIRKSAAQLDTCDL